MRGAGGLATRRVEPEILDALPADDPQALGSRRDLARINAIMLQPGLVAGALAAHLPAGPLRLLDVGAGDGAFALAVARRLARRWPAAHVLLLDQKPAVSPARVEAFAKLGWTAEPVTADLFRWLAAAGQGRFDAVLANLVLHHFDDVALTALFAGIARLTSVFVAAEPRRAALALAGARLVGLIGANRVSRHDATASVRAGFRDGELAALWPDRPGWRIEERPAGLFSHLFVATRSASPA